MPIDFSKLQLNAEDPRAVRLMRGLRAVAGVALVVTIYLAMVILMVPDLFDRSVTSATATEPSHLPESPAAAIPRSLEHAGCRESMASKPQCTHVNN